MTDPIISISTTLVFNGTFTPNTVIYANSTPLPTTYLSPNSVSAVVPLAILATLAANAITAVEPPAVPPNPVPVMGGLFAMAPTNLDNWWRAAAILHTTAGQPDSLIRISQLSGFMASTQVFVNGIAVPTTYDPQGFLTFTLAAAPTANVGTVLVTLKNPPPGGGVSPMGFVIIVESP